MPKRSLKRQIESDSVTVLDNGNDNGDGPSKRSKKDTTRKRQYVPQYRSGAYGIIMALSSVDRNSTAATAGMTKQRIIDIAQVYTNTSFMAPSDPTKYYMAWNSMKTLIDKGLVTEWGRPLRKYLLTDEGWEISAKIRAAAESTSHSSGRKTTNKATPPTSAHAESSRDTEAPTPETLDLANNKDWDVFASSNSASSQPEDDDNYETQITSPPRDEEPGPSLVSSNLCDIRPSPIPSDAFTIELVLDNREIRSLENRDYIRSELTRLGINPIIRRLDIGDVQWIAKCKDPTLLPRLGAEGDELVLDWIIERKRMDDLISSFSDGRYHEQKQRLKRCGVPNVVYVIEEIPMDSKHYSKFEDAVASAMASLQVVSGYFVKRTHKLDETIQYLVRLTKLIRRVYSTKTLHVVPAATLTAETFLPVLKNFRSQDPANAYSVSYAAFSVMASKSALLTLRDVFLKMLMTFKNVTPSIAFAMQERWKTPNELISAYRQCGAGPEGNRKKACMAYDALSGKTHITRQASVNLALVWGHRDGYLQQQG
ncbi:hypothetical protein TD95_003796 [Thielaviopsis punctulata]|uniref:Crossover junction endonuclease MUS81 n=1 Tax=Thielaviopsis punctulata TaxID=72032 RepID=A0A0F4ZF22_9PEZI|nr:hypothetical protein TD95_003796 [Thielaviopsis punctulata]